jgi:hypothetical protein
MGFNGPNPGEVAGTYLFSLGRQVRSVTVCPKVRSLRV